MTALPGGDEIQSTSLDLTARYGLICGGDDPASVSDLDTADVDAAWPDTTITRSKADTATTATPVDLGIRVRV